MFSDDIIESENNQMKARGTASARGTNNNPLLRRSDQSATKDHTVLCPGTD